jgi:hypothetical protein
VLQSVGVNGMIMQSASTPDSRHQVVLYAAIYLRLDTDCIRTSPRANATHSDHAGRRGFTDGAIRRKLSYCGFGRDDEPCSRLHSVPAGRSCHSSPGGLIMSAPQDVHRLTNRPRSHRLATRSAVCLPNSECRLTMRPSRQDRSAFLVRLLPPPTPTLRSRAALQSRHPDAGSAARASSNWTRSLRGDACHLSCP